MKITITTFFLLLFSSFTYSQTCDPDNDIYTVTDENAFCTEVVDNVRNFYSNNYPDHTDSYNSGFTVSASDIEHSMCAYPVESASFTPLYEETETPLGCNYTYKFGIAMNGIGFTPNSNEYFENTDDGSNNIEWHVEARYLFNGAFGNNGGHINSFGSYHYHDIPVDYYTDELGIDGAAHSSIVGYAADGFPIYYKYVYSDANDANSSIVGLSSGYTLKSGTRPGDGVSAPDGSYTGLYYEDYEYSTTTLDECNGRYGVTPDYPYGTYYYVLTDEYPYIPRCFKGSVLDNTFRSLSNCPESTAADDCAAEVQGCMDPFSNNYNSNANVDDGSCAYDITWDGETSTDWATATNWDGDELPTSLDKVIIPDVAKDPTITSDIEINQIVVQIGAVLTVSTNSLTANGKYTVNGNVFVESGASLILLSNTSGSGSTTIHRNTTFGTTNGQYSIIGSPITNGNTDDLGSIVYSYDELTPYGTNGNDRFNLITSSTAMSIGDAYFSANTGDISFTGIPNNDDESIGLEYDETNDGGATNAGFNLVSNPYPAAISYDDFMAGNSDIDGTLYFWDDGGSNLSQRTNSDYITVTGMAAAGNGSGRSGDWDGYIRSAQGFFVKATNAGSVEFTASMMTTGNNTDAGYFRKTKPSTVRFSLSNDGVSTDMVIGFVEDGTKQFDRTLDAYKIKGNSYLQLYSRMQDRAMAIQALPLLIDQTNVDLGLDISESGTYKLSISEQQSFHGEIILKDNLLNREVSLTEIGSYTFDSEETYNSERFSLTFAPNKILSITNQLEEDKLIVFSNGNFLNLRSEIDILDATVIIYNLSGNIIDQRSKVDITSDDWSIVFQRTGMFILTVFSDEKSFVKKFIK